MFAFNSGSQPALLSCALAALLGLTGCASDQSKQYAAENAAVASGPAVAQAYVEVEGDGMPAQTPPSPRIRQMPDDPSEPYSRNYGGINPSAVKRSEPRPQENVPAPVPAVPDRTPTTWQPRVVSLVQDE